MDKKKKGKNKSKKVEKKRKLNKKRVFIFLFIVFLLSLLIYKIFNVNITNIYIKNNNYLTDQEIIDIADLKNYPNSMNNLCYKIKDRLESNQYILSAKVKKLGFFNKVYIDVVENYSLFYYLPENKTVLYNGDKVNNNIAKTTVINKISSTVYDEFLEKMQKVNIDVLSRMSEIKYNPNEVDDERFFVLMNDGNYVYLTIDKFLTINKYVDLIKPFKDKKGIFYLDSGEYFEVFKDENSN